MAVLEFNTMERRASAGSSQRLVAATVGVPVIDQEHKALFANLDRLNADAEAWPGSAEFSEVLSRLGRQINAHFDTEEQILRACAMPAEMVLAHVQAHTEILDQYARLNLDLMVGRQVTREEALAMIRRWIVAHVLHHDVKIQEYLPDTTAEASASN